MTPTDQDNELRALLDEFVLYTDSSPESNEPTELKLFLERCDFPDAIDRLYSELVQLITANYTPNSEVAERERLAMVGENVNWRYGLQNQDLSQPPYVTIEMFSNRIAELQKGKGNE